MFSAVFKEVSGVLDRRFLLTVFFPSLIFWGLLIVLIVSTQVGILPAAEKWNEQESFRQISTVPTNDRDTLSFLPIFHSPGTLRYRN